MAGIMRPDATRKANAAARLGRYGRKEKIDSTRMGADFWSIRYSENPPSGLRVRCNDLIFYLISICYPYAIF